MLKIDDKVLQETATLIKNARVGLSELKDISTHYKQICPKFKFEIICQHYLQQIDVLEANLIWDKDGNLSIEPLVICNVQDNIFIEKLDDNKDISTDNIKSVKLKIT